jgi:hypothetical protein
MATEVKITVADYNKYATILRSLITAANAAKAAKNYELLHSILNLEHEVEAIYVQLISN